MAIAKGLIPKGLSGQLEGKLVFKRYGNKTIVTKFPDMTNIKPSKEQKTQRKLFARAVVYAKVINNNPELKKAYKKKVKNRQTVFQYAMKEFMKNPDRCTEKLAIIMGKATGA
jgi:hemoglobin-like flavoprotein